MKNRNYILFFSLIIASSIVFSCGKKDISAEKGNFEESVNLTETSMTGTDARKNTASGIVRGIKVRNIGPLSRVFNDSNYLQLEAAQRLGIDPLSDLSSFYFTKRPIVKISNSKYYHLDSLRHSVPYLVPEAATLLEDIGKNFIDSLDKRGGDSYTIKVTSLLRTPASVGRLRRVNVNATDSSTHQYGTTFDISYTNFYCLDENRQINQGDLKNLLGEVLNDLRKSGRCYVKYEHKTGCFHVTARQ